MNTNQNRDQQQDDNFRDDPFAISDEMLNDDDDTLIDDLIGNNIYDNQNDDADDGAEDDDGDDDDGADDGADSFRKELFGSDDDDDADDADDQYDLDQINKMLKKDFKTQAEVKAFLEKEDDAQESEFEKETSAYEKALEDHSYWDTFKNLDNESIVRNNLKNTAIQNGEDLNDQDILDDIEDEIQAMRDNRTLNSNGETLRTAAKQRMQELKQNTIDVYEQKKAKIEADKQRKIESELQSEFADIYSKGNFFGVTPTQDKIKNAYDSVKENKFMEALQGNKKLQAKIALFVELEGEISKRTNSDFSDGVESILSELKPEKNNRSRIRSSQATGSSATRGSLSLSDALAGRGPKAKS